MIENKKLRQIKFYKDYFQVFFSGLPKAARDKFVWTFQLIEEQPRPPIRFLRHIEGRKGMYEVKVQVGTNAYRAFCIFEPHCLIILNGFQKKTQKTPKSEIKMALRIKSEYENEGKSLNDS